MRDLPKSYSKWWSKHWVLSSWPPKPMLFTHKTPATLASHTTRSRN